MKSGGPLDAAVVIPTRNGGPRFRDALEAVLNQDTDLRYEVVVIDSASRDGTDALARAWGARVLTADPRTFNHGATRDVAITHTRAPAVALLVQDAVPVNRVWLERLVQPLLEDEGAAGSFSRQLPIPGGNPILDERLRGWIAGKDESRRAALDDRDWQDLDPFERLHLVAFDNVSSCVKRARWQEHPFGQRPFGEDMAWATWAIRAGHAIRFEAASVVEHSHDRSAWYETRRIYCDHRNLNQLLGLHTVKDLAQVRRGSQGALDHYEKILDAAHLPPEEDRRRRRWARRYALGEALAQWLAPRVNAAGERGLLGVVDRWLRRGI